MIEASFANILLTLVEPIINSNIFLSIANISSISSLAVSGYTLYLVRFIKIRYIFRSRLSENFKKIDSDSSDILSLLSDYSNNRYDIESTLKKLEVTIKDLKNGADKKELKSEIDSALQNIEKYFNNSSETLARDVRLNLVGIREHLVIEIENMKAGI